MHAQIIELSNLWIKGWIISAEYVEKIVALSRNQNCLETYPHIMSYPYNVANKNETILSIRIIILTILLLQRNPNHKILYFNSLSGIYKNTSNTYRLSIVPWSCTYEGFNTIHYSCVTLFLREWNIIIK